MPQRAGFNDLVALLGERDALNLCRAFGGIKLSVPARPSCKYPLARVLDAKALCKLCSKYAGDELYIPKADGVLRVLRNRAIFRAHDEGVPVRELALKHRLSERRIWSLLKKIRESSPASILLSD